MDRPALQDKKNKLDAGRENLLQALSALSLLAETERTLNEAKENEKALNAKVEACQKAIRPPANGIRQQENKL